MAALGEKIKKLRKEKVLNQADLAEQTGVTQQQVAKWESGKSTPPMDKLVLLSGLFNVGIDHLTGTDDESENTLLRRENASLRELLKVKDELIESLKSQNKLLSDRNA